MQTQKFDFAAIMSKTNFLNGHNATDSANAVQTISSNAVRRLVKALHPAISNAARPQHLVLNKIN